MGWGKFANTVDVCAISGDEVMLIRRKKPPFMNYWGTVGGFFNHSEFKNKETGEMEKPDASLEHAAQREFREEAGLDIPVTKFTQIKTYSHMFDPRLRIIDTAFVVHIPGKDKKKAVAGDDAADEPPADAGCAFFGSFSVCFFFCLLSEGRALFPGV